MHIRLINLERSSDRLALFSSRNAHLPDIVRVRAIDGKQVNRQRLIDNNVLTPELSYTDGALGCALSHLTQWRDAIQTNTALTIVEDDAVLCANFQQEAGRVLASLPDHWEYVMWGYNFDAPLTYDLGTGLSPCTSIFNQANLTETIATFGTQELATTPFRLMRGFGTVCYSISPRGASRLLDFCMPLRPMETEHPGLAHKVANKGIDNMMAEIWPSISAYVAMPPLALTLNEAATSTVQSTRRDTQPPGTPAQRPTVQSFDLFDTLVARRCIHPEAVFQETEASRGIPGFTAARLAAERELQGTEYSLDDIYARLAQRTNWPSEQITALRDAELEAEWSNLMPIAEVLAQVGPSDLIISDMYLPYDFLERVVRDKANLPFNTLIATTNGKRSGRIWDVLARDFSIIQHHGDNEHTDYHSPRAAGIPALLARPADPSPLETVLTSGGMPALGRAIRAARLSSFDGNEARHRLQRAQIEVNLPLLTLSCAHLAREMEDANITRALVSGRDGYRMQQILGRTFTATGNDTKSSVYFLTSRAARAQASPDYRRYVSDLMRGEQSVTVDLCGTGWSLSRMLDQMDLPDTEATIYLVHHIDNSPLNQTYRAFGEIAPRPIVAALRGDHLPNNRFELLNLTDHAMVRDIRYFAGRPMPIFLNNGHDAATRPIIACQDQAFDRGLAELTPTVLREVAAVPTSTLLLIMEALYVHMAALPDALFQPFMREQKSEETYVHAALEQSRPVNAG